MQIKEGKSKSLRERTRLAVNLPKMFLDWSLHAQKSKPVAVVHRPLRSVVLVSADVRDPVGSKGDEAMIIAVSQRIRRDYPDCRIILATTDITPPDRMRLLNIECRPIWRSPWTIGRVLAEMKEFDAAYFVGADVVDGYYSTITSLRMWMIADLLHRSGVLAVIGGCSFNSTATTGVKTFLKHCISKTLDICIRDAASLARFQATSRNPATLVADSAFMLRPTTSEAVEKADQWIAAQRSEGRIICGLNIHPMLIPDRDPVQIENLVQAAAHAAKTLIANDNVSIVLIPHDFRLGGQSDLVLLERVQKACGETDRVYLTADLTLASEIKFMAEKCDLVVTGRMHLAIAALGSSVPVAVVDYQDKFVGLFKHFTLPTKFIIQPEEAKKTQAFYEFCASAVANRAELARLAASRQPDVMAQSERNVQTLLSRK